MESGQRNDPEQHQVASTISRRALLGAAGGLGIGAAAWSLGQSRSGATAPTAASPEAATGVTREYFIAAEEFDWDYAPGGIDRMTGAPLATEPYAIPFTQPGDVTIGSVYRKAHYVAYTDDTFTTPVPIDPAWHHLGILGPLIRAEVGDRVLVHFRNQLWFPASIHPHGLAYDKANEGAYYPGAPGDTGDDLVPPGGSRDYHWGVPERSGPGPADPSSIMWMYHSHVNEVTDTNAGLIGPMIVTRRGEANADALPRDVDREFMILFSVMDENESPFLAQNIAKSGWNPLEFDRGNPEFFEGNLKHAINGYIFSTLPGLDMRTGERVRWYVAGIGNEVDLHTPHWHGQTLEWMGMRTDMTELLPMSMKVLDMRPDMPGIWLFHCHVNDHLESGMTALFTVSK